MVFFVVEYMFLDSIGVFACRLPHVSSLLPYSVFASSKGPGETPRQCAACNMLADVIFVRYRFLKKSVARPII